MLVAALCCLNGLGALAALAHMMAPPTLEDREKALFERKAKQLAEKAKKWSTESEASTRLPDDERDDVQTTGSRVSSSRSAGTLGPKRKARDTRRHEQRMVERYGDAYVPPEVLRLSNMAATGLQSVEEYEEMKQKRDAKPITLKRRVEHMTAWLNAAFALPDLKAGRDSIPLHLIVNPAGQCTCCGNKFDEWHAATTKHLQAVKCVNGLNDLLGVRPLRGLNTGYKVPLGTGQCLTRQGLRNFWGPETDLLPLRALQRMRQVGGVNIKSSSKKHDFVPARLIAGCGLGIVNYTGTEGVYSDKNLVIIWENIPEDHEAIANNPSLLDIQLQQSMSDQSFWPVVVVSFVDHPQTAHLCGVCYITCIYQLLDGILYAWAIAVADWLC